MPTEETSKEIIKGIKQTENIVRLYSATIFKRHQIKPEQIEVHLVQDMNAYWKALGGHIVHLYLRWPEIQPVINEQLHDFCAAFKKQRLHRTMEVVPYMLSHVGMREWAREKFTSEEQIILDLIPKSRLRVKKTEITTIEDTITGETISVSYESAKKRFDGEETSMWIDLSRIVNKKYPFIEDENKDQA